jgi:excisionase family DNA binding protein
MDTHMGRMIYSVKHAAELLDCSENTVWNLLTEGKLKGLKMGRSRRITHAELVAYIESLTVQEP